MPELRQDPVVKRWVIVATERTRRPNEFTDHHNSVPEPKINPFAEGNEDLTPPEIHAVRSTESRANSPGWKLRVIPNKFPVLRIEGTLEKNGDGLYDQMNGIGAHEVLIESPRHDQQFEEQPLEGVASIVDTYRLRVIDLLKDTRFRYVLVFKNFGRDAGATISHPHSQIIATPVIPKVVKEKLAGAQTYYDQKERNIFGDILKQELKDTRRIVYQNAAFVCFCPYASRFPFELCIMPRRQSPDFHAITSDEILQLADVLKVSLLKLQRGLNRPQYNFFIHTAPARYPRKEYWTTLEQDYRWHIEVTPRLTQIAGFEVGTGFHANPVTPEDAAQFLKGVEV
jgi:UDPglucose--hexose-1-phosphate uridylyltransferase